MPKPSIEERLVAKAFQARQDALEAYDTQCSCCGTSEAAHLLVIVRRGERLKVVEAEVARRQPPNSEMLCGNCYASLVNTGVCEHPGKSVKTR